jgi:hypothetical protein
LLERWNEGLSEPLAATIEFARRDIPHYRATIPEFRAGSVLDSLLQLPVLTKRGAIREKHRLRLTDEPGRIGRFSTGTTRRGHEYLDVQRIPAEAFAVKVFSISGGDWNLARDPALWNPSAIEQLTREYGRGERAESSFSVLHVENLHYESWPVNEQPGVTPVAWSHHPNCIQSIVQHLSQPAHKILRIESGTLVKMTMLVRARGFDFESTAIDTIGVYGWLSPRWRRWLEEIWGARIIEVFSMSELRSVARECKSGGHFHFDELPIVTEVLDPISGLHTFEGQGELVVTTLFPFAQQQPLLRYATGDLVEIIPCTLDPRLGFRWSGRLMHAAPRTEMTYAGERRFMDLLDELPDVERSPDDFETLGLIPKGTVGWPCFWLERSTTDLALHAVLRYQPEFFTARANEIERALDLPIVWHGPGDHEALRSWMSFAEPLYPFTTLL